MGRRFTVIHGGGRRSEVADNWSETWETTGWTGYTLFLQRLVDGPPQPADQSQSSTQPAAVTQLDEDVEEDGSFELVEDDAGSEHHPGDHGSGPRLRAMSLLSSATSATGLSVTSASTRLDADEGEMGLMDLPEVDQGQLEDSIPSGKGSGSASPEKSPKGKGYPKKGTMSPKTKKMSPTTMGTSLGNVDGDLECVDGETVADLNSLRSGSSMSAGSLRPALRYLTVMSDGRGGLDERCPGKPKAKKVSLKPARHGVSTREGEREPAPVTLRPSRAHEQQEQEEDEVQLVEDSPQAEGESSRRVVLVEEDELSPEEGELPAQEGHTSGEGELQVQEPLQGEDELPEEVPQLGVEVKTEEGPKLKKYRRVRVKKKAPLEREIKEMHGKQRMRSERMACLRLLQQDRRKAEGAELARA